MASMDGVRLVSLDASSLAVRSANFGPIPPISERKVMKCGGALAKASFAVVVEFELM
jgi:hypothetical protein